jgi:hypothetical protein
VSKLALVAMAALLVAPAPASSRLYGDPAAGNLSRACLGETHVKTVRDGAVVTLDHGAIHATSLRAEGDGFV